MFGQYVRDVDYIERPSAYAILPDPLGRIAVVRTSRGYYLPGGGLEGAEDAPAAVERECQEECGLTIRNLRALGTAIQLMFAEGEGWFRIIGTFFIADLMMPFAGTSDGCTWLEPTAAAHLMTRQFERWAIETWMRDFGC